MYFVSGRSLNSSRETEFGASRSLADFYQRREQHCSRPAAFKNATVRERPEAEVRREKEQTFTPCFVSGIRYAVPGTTSLALGVGVAFDAACKDRVPFE